MIDFSNTVELKDLTFTHFDQVITGKVAEITNAVAHWDYFPAEMLHQFSPSLMRETKSYVNRSFWWKH